MTESPNKPAFKKNNSSKSASSKNNDSRPASGKNDNDNIVNKFDVYKNGIKYAKKSKKLFRSGKSKIEKMSKS